MEPKCWKCGFPVQIVSSAATTGTIVYCPKCTEKRRPSEPVHVTDDYYDYFCDCDDCTFLDTN